jgi:hypothetical protein
MQLDQETLTPVIIAMLIYITAVIVVPKIVRKPTGIQFIDDIVMTLITQKDSLMSGTVIIGLIVLATNYIQEELM